MAPEQPSRADELRSRILDMVTEYHAEAFSLRVDVG